MLRENEEAELKAAIWPDVLPIFSKVRDGVTFPRTALPPMSAPGRIFLPRTPCVRSIAFEPPRHPFPCDARSSSRKGERAHYELAAGRVEEAWRLLHTMEAFASPNGMLPEQVWDAENIPERGLFLSSIPPESALRIELLAPATVHWSLDNWETVQDTATTDSHLGVHYFDLTPENFSGRDETVFTFHWRDSGAWKGQDFRVKTAPS
jgi:hypothetical protein